MDTFFLPGKNTFPRNAIFSWSLDQGIIICPLSSWKPSLARVGITMHGLSMYMCPLELWCPLSIQTQSHIIQQGRVGGASGMTLGWTANSFWMRLVGGTEVSHHTDKKVGKRDWRAPPRSHSEGVASCENSPMLALVPSLLWPMTEDAVLSGLARPGI